MSGSRSAKLFTNAARLLGLLTILALPATMRAQGWAIQGQVVDSTGRPTPFATVRVCPYTASGAPCSPLTSLWSDILKTNSIPNPYTTDQAGNYSFVVAAAQSYIVQIYSGGIISQSYLYTAGATTTSGTGTVTSAGLTAPSWLTVAGSPITTAGTFVITATGGQTANEFLATPNGTTGAVGLRAIVPADLPKATSSTFGVIEPDNTTCTVSNGILTCPGSGSLPSPAYANALAFMNPGNTALTSYSDLTATTVGGVHTLTAPSLSSLFNYQNSSLANCLNPGLAWYNLGLGMCNVDVMTADTTSPNSYFSGRMSLGQSAGSAGFQGTSGTMEEGRVDTMFFWRTNHQTAGIKDGLAAAFNAAGVGDTDDISQYWVANGGAAYGSDQGVIHQNWEGGEGSTPTLVVASYSEEPNTLTYSSVTCANDNAAHICETAPGTWMTEATVATGHFTGPSVAFSVVNWINQLPTSGSLPTSSVYGYNTSTTVNVNTTFDQPTSQSITFTGGLGSFASGNSVCVVGGTAVDGQGWVEESVTTAVSGTSPTQTITLPLGRPINGGVYVVKGHCYVIGFDADLALGGVRTAYIGLPSLDGTNLPYVTEAYGETNRFVLPQTGLEPETTDSTSYANFHLFLGARVWRNNTVPCGAAGQQCLVSTVVGPNGGAWTTGETVYDTNLDFQNIQTLYVTHQCNTPGVCTVAQLQAAGMGFTGNQSALLTLGNNNPASMYINGMFEPSLFNVGLYVGNGGTGLFSRFFNAAVTPSDSLFHFNGHQSGQTGVFIYNDSTSASLYSNFSTDTLEVRGGNLSITNGGLSSGGPANISTSVTIGSDGGGHADAIFGAIDNFTSPPSRIGYLTNSPYIVDNDLALFSGARSSYTVTPNVNLWLAQLNATNVLDSVLTPGDCVQAGTGGILTSASGACGGGSWGVTNGYYGLGVSGAAANGHLDDGVTTAGIITSKEPITVAGDGVHAGFVGIYGNTANPTLPSNELGFLGPTSASFTSIFYQLSTTAPTAGQVMAFSAPVGGVSTQSWVTPGGTGTVTSFSAGNLSPLFTTSVATATTTPALSFSLSNAAQNSVFAGPASGGAGAPSYQTAPTISAANMTNFPTFFNPQTNSTNNSSQTTLNFETSTTNAVGLTVTPSNPSGGIEKMEVTGTYTGGISSSQVTTGLGYTPANCTAGTSGSDCLTLSSGLVPVANLPVPFSIANTTITVGTSAITANSCNSVSTVTMTGAATTQVVVMSPTSDVSAVLGWSPNEAGQLYFIAWVSAANTVSYYTCNPTGTSLTPGASTTWNVGLR